MEQIQNTKSFRRFSRNLFLIGRVYVERNKAKEDVYSQLDRMRKSIIRMSLSYSDVDRLRAKIDNLIDWERRYAKLFKPEDKELESLKIQIAELEGELNTEREEKLMVISENDEKIAELTNSFHRIKDQIRNLHLEKASRDHRLRALEKKIVQDIDVSRYYHS